jgi:hypothetical protein
MWLTKKKDKTKKRKKTKQRKFGFVAMTHHGGC